MWDIFGGDLPSESLEVTQVIARTVLIFVFGVAVVRIGKSRLLATSTPIDILMGFVIGSTLSRGITGTASLTATMTSSVVLIVLHAFFTGLAYRSHFLGGIVKGHSRPLIIDGELQRDNMRRSHISEHDLLEALRSSANIEDPAQVRVAYKERNGTISVIRRERLPFVVGVDVEDGVKRVQIHID